MGQIVCTDKGILAVEQNKVLIPPTWNKTFAWGYADLSCRLGTYESDKVCTVACSRMSSCLMGVGIAQAKGFSAAPPQPRGRSAPYLTVSVIGGGFIKLFSQVETNLCVLECALSPDHHSVPLLTDDHCWFSHIAHLPSGKAHT